MSHFCVMFFCSLYSGSIHKSIGFSKFKTTKFCKNFADQPKLPNNYHATNMVYSKPTVMIRPHHIISIFGPKENLAQGKFWPQGKWPQGKPVPREIWL